MADHAKILWLIAARSGSKGLPGKNIRELAGWPLLAYRIKSAAASRYNEHIWCSTDSQEYAAIANKYGAQIPFIRPAELATDIATSADVVCHALEYARSISLTFDYIGLLEPTSPFVYPEYLDQAVALLDASTEAEAIVAVRESTPHPLFIQDDNPFLDKISENIANIQKLGRQNFKKQITPSGGFYIARTSSFEKLRSFYTAKTMGFLLPFQCELEIDSERDWLWAEFLCEKNVVKQDKIFSNEQSV